ncbi:SpoIIE family protein phosphatase [Streptomyces sp. NPDC001068]|uniref:SpoIIE family protein phosphatase n=1 Tax=Streptomyces sp. NPDC001068 TaxID=3364544 RepID=UPI0036AA9A44
MTNTDRVTLGKRLNTREVSESAVAMLDERGTVVAWTQAAEQLLGYSAGDVVGRSAALILPSSGKTPISALIEQSHAHNDWSGTCTVRHSDGRMLDINHRISMLRGQGGAFRWLVSVTDIGTLSQETRNGSVRESLLTHAPIGIVIRDLQLRCVWTNDTAETHDGISPNRRLGRLITDSLPGFEAEALEAMQRQALRNDTTAVHEYRAWPTEDPSREHALAVSYFCLQDADAKTLGLCGISVDVTGSQRARERLAILSQASTRIGSTLDVMRTGQELADLAVPVLADFVYVDLGESVPFGKEPSTRIDTTSDRPTAFLRAGQASIHPGTPESTFARGETVFVPPASPLAGALRTGRSYLEPVLDTSPGTWVDHDPARAQKIREYEIHSVMIVPIIARRAVLGVAVFFRTQDPAPFHEDDLLLAEELVTRAALCLDNARQYTREHTAALTLQRNLLPHHLTGGAAVEVAWRYLPADADAGVGGDWFDVIPLSGARVALVVGDVVGHGINAAATMGRLRTAVRTLADLELPPDQLLAHLDDTFQRLAEQDADTADQTPTVVGATCLYAVYDPATRKCTMAGAGHPPPAIIDPQGQVTFPELPTGSPLGLGLGVPFEAVELELPEGTLLGLYTDGLIETRDADIDVGMRCLGTALAQPSHPLEELCTRATDALPPQAPGDDITLLLARTHSLSPTQVASWTLPNDRTAIPNARHMATRQLAEWGLESLQDPTQLIVSELVTNAVRHSTDPIGLRLIHHETLTCEVSDTDANSPRLRHARTTDENGRGLFLITQLSRRWGARTEPGGKVIWAEQDLDSAPSHAPAPGTPPPRKE